MSGALLLLEDRIAALERKHHGCESEDHISVDESMRRARRAVEMARIYSATWKFVPENYYSWPLSQRATCLGAPDVQYLCKSLLMENKKAGSSAGGRPVDPTYPKFVLVVIQYAATLDVRQLVNAIRALRPVKERYDENQFDFRIASEADNDRLTGYRHNSVTPFGLLASREEITIVLSQAVIPLKFFWMGGGHVLLKLGMAVTEFCEALQPIVAPISQPRSEIELHAPVDDD